MTPDITHIACTDSTNRWMAEQGREGVVWADFQTAGRGCGTNRWESAPGENLLFSVLLRPSALPAIRQFVISMAISVALVDALHDSCADLSIKWPNDIYWRDRKLGGILIENRIGGNVVLQSIVGVGLNVNQRVFVSDAPNPVSLSQITGHEHDREELLRRIIDRFTLAGGDTADRYRKLLYRRQGFHPYRDADGDFSARLEGVEDDGHLLLCDETGRVRRYAFKEVSFLL